MRDISQIKKDVDYAGVYRRDVGIRLNRIEEKLKSEGRAMATGPLVVIPGDIYVMRMNTITGALDFEPRTAA